MSVLKQGDVLFDETIAPAGRDRVAMFSEATDDPNPIHVDDDFAHKAGFKTVLQQGPMTTAQFARLLDKAVGGGTVRSLDITFTAPVYPDDTLTLRAEILELGAVTRCALSAVKSDGTQTAKGVAEVSVHP
jgi:acyl dehydratase